MTYHLKHKKRFFFLLMSLIFSVNNSKGDRNVHHCVDVKPPLGPRKLAEDISKTKERQQETADEKLGRYWLA